jgi:small multidrug resistance pump
MTQPANAGLPDEPLLPWMRFVLRFAGTFNLLAGFCMVVFYHEGYHMLGEPKPALVLPVQIMGILVGLFGVGYHCVAARPAQNRDLLMLGLLSKAISATAALYYVAVGRLPWPFALVVFFADVIYVPPFWVIGRRLRRIAQEDRHSCLS